MTIDMIVALIGASIVAYVIANRFRLIAPVLLIAAGVGVAFLPVGDEMHLSSTVVLTIFLPILLYWESLSVSLNRMRRSLRGIILSATVLVAITAALIALIGVLMGLSAGAALLIGACLGPTDATAVSSLGRGINPNGRTILQAESLLNDGTALVVFAIALQTAQDSSDVTVALVAKDLLLSFGGGVGAGAVVGAIVTKIGIRIRTIVDDPMLATITALATPFVTFFLAEEILPAAGRADAVGRERYERFSREFLGAVVDLDETYEWGRERLAAIDAEQRAIAERLYGPGTGVREAMDRLNADPARTVHGTAALRDWMQQTSDRAMAALDGVHFDIPAPLRVLECRIAPSATGGIYYTGPSDDFSRPGRMWWSVPAGTEDFATWQERTTVFHEGVPGHHLQVGMQTHLRSELNSWRRLACWVSGHGEGWALYAERLMADLGFQDDPGDRFGMLDSQRLRAARVVLDIGVHLGKERPPELAGLPGVGEGVWDAGSAWAFLRHNVAMEESFLRFELDRYLGLPGQAPSYAVGQRLWEEARDRALAGGTGLKDFHTRALHLGSVGLDVLRRALA